LTLKLAGSALVGSNSIEEPVVIEKILSDLNEKRLQQYNNEHNTNWINYQICPDNHTNLQKYLLNLVR
jgi:hypothetical protein